MPQRSVLLVNGGSENREILRAYLEHHRYRVLDTPDFAEAMEIVRAEKPALVIAELGPGVMPTVSFIEQVRQDPLIAGTRILTFTSHAFEHVRLQATQAGADGFLSKPARLADILAEVTRLIGPAIAPDDGDA